MTTRDAVKKILLLTSYSNGNFQGNDPHLYEKAAEILEQWRESLKGAWSGDRERETRRAYGKKWRAEHPTYSRKYHARNKQ
jgi:hypothetical protein